MRFFAKGPNIPDSLLEDRDKGRVVFFCGAGVSIPSGMPDFLQLAWDVVACLRVPKRTIIHKSFKFKKKSSRPFDTKVPLDQIFNNLYMEYGRDLVNRIVAKKLATSGCSEAPKEHRIIAKLSTGPDGKPLIVTTNFDRLFELPGMTFHEDAVFEPPTFPDLLQGRPVSGIVYLHGRLRENDASSHELILSNADFGRAYLSEGWATNFVRQLLENYTVVLLGYRAQDPPVRYLLQGLESAANRPRGRLYAFDQGSFEDVQAKWGYLGVTPIAYPDDKPRHKRLWDSLEAWASRADDPATWRTGIIANARKGPGALHPYERGQVAHVVSSTNGAKAFADAEPIMPAEWLCVFDSAFRLRQSEKIRGKVDGSPVREQYALDDDATESSRDGSRSGHGGDLASSHEMSARQKSEGRDLIAWSLGDERPTSTFRLSTMNHWGFEELPPRLSHLCRWIAANSSNPIVAWWVARQGKLHPRLASMIFEIIERADEFPSIGSRVWNMIFENLERNDYSNMEMNWSVLNRRVKHEGWTPSTLSAFQICAEPFVKIDNENRRDPDRPPSDTWQNIRLNDIANFSVEFPIEYVDPVHVPDDAACEAFSLISRNLVKGVERLGWLEEAAQGQLNSLKHLTFYQEKNGNGISYQPPEALYVLRFAGLMKRAANIDPKHVSSAMSLWPTGDLIILDKLRLYAWNQPEVFSGDQVTANLMEMGEGAFWNPHDRREFLFLLRERWRDFSEHGKSRLLDRMLVRRESNPIEKSSITRGRLDTEAIIRIRWLESHGCNFHKDAQQRIVAVQEKLPAWNENLAVNAAQSWAERSGWHEIKTKDDSSVLDNVTLPQVVETAQIHTGWFDDYEDKRPFDGLVRNHPVRALSALGSAMRRGDYSSPEFWGVLVNEWPVDAPRRATRLLCERLRRLPVGVIASNARDVSYWMRNKLPAIAKEDEPFALEIFDDLLSPLVQGGPEINKGVNCEIRVNGGVVERSRHTFHHAITTPIGYATEGLLTILHSRDLPDGHGIPEEFATRLESLVSASEQVSDHAISLIAYCLQRLHRIDPDWVKSHVVPLFEKGHPSSEPAWSGLLYREYVPEPDLFEAIKTHFLKLFPRMYAWHWEVDEFSKAHYWFIMTAIRNYQEHGHTSLEKYAKAMRRLSEDGRSDVIRKLGHHGQKIDNGWVELVIPLLDELWPKELRYQTDRASEAFLHLLGDSGNAFPQLLDSLRHFLRPIRHRFLPLHRFYRDEAEQEEPITKQFPTETLDLMDFIVGNEEQTIPYSLTKVLELISEICPDLTRDRKYQRLEDLIAARR